MFGHDRILVLVAMPAVLFLVAGGSRAEDAAAGPITVRTDSGTRGGAVALEALPAKGGNNALMKRFHIGSLEGIESADLMLLAALRDPTDRNDFSFDVWEWIFFELNGHGWVLRVEDMPLYRRGLFPIEWDDVRWASVAIPDIHYLREGENNLVIWNSNLPQNPKDRFLVVAYDDTGRSADSFSLVDGEWHATDLDGDRDGAPVGEWMIRLKLNPYPHDEQKRRDALGPERFRQAFEEKRDFVWGFTDPIHKIFPDGPYDGPVGNTWEIDAARNEYESCQLVIVPVSVDMEMAEVRIGDFRSAEGAVIPSSAATVRVVRTARVNHREWPDPLPEAFPVEIPRGRVQPFWITVHVPSDSPAGLYRAELTIHSMSTAGKGGQAVTVPLTLRVRDFAIPKLSCYQMVAPSDPQMQPYHIVNISAHGTYPAPKMYLDKEENLRLEFDEFDGEMARLLAEGVTQFSIGLSYTGANNFAPWTFDWRVPAEGGGERRIWVNPVDKDDPDADTPENRQARKWFRQYLSAVYNHLEEKGWTRYWFVYGADEPHNKEWIAPLTRYFALIKEIAPKLRILIAKGPTQEYGPNAVDIAVIMMNHLRQDTAESASKLNQELWCYSCGDLNNPALTIPHPAITVRWWHWLQEKWKVERVLLWHTSVQGDNVLHPGCDGLGDGQVFWVRQGPDDERHDFPSIRAEMLRDGVEDREYIHLLKELTEKYARSAPGEAGAALLAQARKLAEIPDDLVETQFRMTRDPQKLLDRRRDIADLIEALQERLPDP